jgi:mRNA interferase RelE/StbE
MLPGPVTRPGARPGRSDTCRMKKRAAAWACQPGELSGQLGDSGSGSDGGFLRDDPAGVAALWDTAGQLASEPRPPESFPSGSPDLRRLRAGRYRVFYTIDEEQRVVQIDHVARLP